MSHRWHAEEPRAESSTTGTPTPAGRASSARNTAEDVVALQGHVVEESTLARPRRRGALGAAARHGLRQLAGRA